MKVLIVFSAILAMSLAKPSLVGSPLTYAAPLAYAKLVPGAPIGHDGRVVDTPEVAVAKAEHAAAHINEKVTLAHEAVKSADILTYAAPVAPVVSAHGVISAYSAHAVASPLAYAAPVAYAKLVPGAPIGHDGRVVDTPEVAVAKAEHAAAHINERVTLAHEATKSYAAPVVVSAYSAPLVSTYAAHPAVSVW